MNRAMTIIVMLVMFCASAWAQRNSGPGQNAIGVENGNAGRLNEAMTNFNSSIVIYDAEAAKTIHNIGWLYELKGENENALTFYEEALKRNPSQLHTLERAGYLRYLFKNYEGAIIYGERALKLNPVNGEVIKWLPDAYAQMFRLKAREIDKAAKEQETQKVAEQVKEQKTEELKRRKVTATYEAMVRWTYYRDGGDFKYRKTDAYGPDFPHMLTVNYMPVDSWEIRGNTGVPYYGALAYDVVSWTERIEALYYREVYFLGMGIMGNHFNGNDGFGGTIKLNDYKLGIVFGVFGERSKFDMSFYPRMLPSDTGTASGRTYDVDTLDIAYSYFLENGYKLNGKISINDFYFFNNSTLLSNYRGIYIFSIGVSINDTPSSKVLFRADLVERVYLLDLNNDKPYAFMNGQGWFGINARKWFKGDPFSGIETCSTGMALYVEERAAPHVFFFQRFLAEFVRKKQLGHDFCISGGIGAYY